VSACESDDEQDRIFDDAHDQLIEENPFLTPQPGNDDDDDNNVDADDIVDANEVGNEQVLTILLSDDCYRWGSVRQMFTNYFSLHRPDVQLVFETYIVRDPHAFDIAEQTALITRLLADPPDIFVRPHFVSYEKLNVEALFFNLNEFLDGENGIDRNNYFDHILRASQTGDALFHIPLMVDMNTVLFAREHFNNIGVDMKNKNGITLRESIDYFHQASELYSGELLLDIDFNLTTLFIRENVYDMTTGEVFVNTPEMRELLFEIAEIPIRPGIEFLPEEVNIRRLFTFPGVDNSFGYSNYLFMGSGRLTGAPFVTLLADYHPGMSFSRPIHRINEEGDITFTNYLGMSILRSSSNYELAWEFIRFCMEITDSLVVGWQSSGTHGAYPINRARFDNWVHDIILYNGVDVIRAFPGAFWTVEFDSPEETAEAVANGVAHFRNLIEAVNAEDRRNIAVFNSLIYPDLFLFATGSQSVDQTLINIQNRLELYIHE